MPVTVTAIEAVPLVEDDPNARASYRLTVSAGGQAYRLLFTVLVDCGVPELPEGLTYLHAHSPDVERELVPRHFDYAGPHPLHRMVFAAYRGDRPALPAVINDRGLTCASDEQ